MSDKTGLLRIPAARKRAVWRSMLRARRFGDINDLEANRAIRLAN
jgi:hypothetical protein